VEKALGSPRRILHVNEKEKRKKIRRSAHLKKPVKKGQNVSSATVEFCRPGYGIAPNQFENIADMHFKKDLSAGHMLMWSDLG
jgi:sialic acid synthase SpsE